MVKNFSILKYNFLHYIKFKFIDLRQDMLALQFIQMIDIIWKADGLDLRFEYFLFIDKKRKSIIKLF